MSQRFATRFLELGMRSSWLWSDGDGHIAAEAAVVVVVTMLVSIRSVDRTQRQELPNWERREGEKVTASDKMTL
ncbi:hypothetical protein L596_029889 [Steinernema carpocapsae]|uniref:Uncharacterized protein n=1 Tax=Steinernema carpocapsae TaxID=34508 RepID=A0A4U5LR38_STECR|nr:hypothetical protein L596_029889 [Steinernema carpocapsae]